MAMAEPTGLASVRSAQGSARENALSRDLLLANEQLVLSALRFEAAADDAHRDLSGLLRTSQRDSLTGLPNRALMSDRMETAIALAQRHGTQLAVLFVDIDDFKRVNDLLGHGVGDAVLCFVANCLVASVRQSDTVSRHGGDEFLVLLNEVTSPADADQVAAKILTHLAEPQRVGDGLPPLMASVGIALFPDDGTDAATLVAHADRDMYRCKRRRTDGLSIHVPRVDADTVAVLPPARTRPLRPLAHAAAEMAGSDLLQANEQLVLAAVAAMQVEEVVAQAHDRHVAFVATVTHELRNPLGPIRNVGLLLSRSYAHDPVLMRLAEIVERQTLHLTRLVEDLMDGARARVGRFTLERTRLDLHEVLQPVLESARESMQPLRQILTCRLPAEPLPIDGDAVRLRQIFGNLLDNASKYTPDGGAVDISAAVVDAMVQITIQDNGIGIDAVALPLIFDLFVQSTDRTPMHRRGLGIGLAVVRELVESHGGTVLARSAGKGQGSCFVVSLPLVDALPHAL